MNNSGLNFLVIFPVTRCRLRLEFIFLFVFLFHVVFRPQILRGQAVPPATGVRTIHGIVKSGNMPIPGAGVSATNTATKDQINTSTDVDGSYSLRVPADGHYSVRVQMAAFSASTREVALDAGHPDVLMNFELILLSRAHEVPNEPQRQANAGRRGFQNLSVFQSEAGQDTGGSSMADIAPSGMPVPGAAQNGATESVAVSGNTTNSFNAMSADEMQQRFADARQQGGGFGSGGGFGGGAAAGARGAWFLVAGVLISIVRMDRSITESAIRR
jgi:hypothetical protein